MEWMANAGTALALVTALGTGAKFYGDHTYVKVADSLRGQLFEKQLEIKRLELQGELSEQDKALLEFLRLQEQELRKELE
jgi:hypothetical protein